MARIVLTLVALASIATVPTSAGDPHHPLCRLFLHEDQREREAHEVALTLARSELAAREQIFVLFDGLWKIQGIDRLTFLTGKHARDRAKVEVERLRLVLDSYDAYLEQYRTYCAALGAGRAPTGDESKRIARGWERYLRSDCDAIAQERSVAEIDLAYRQEYLASVRELRTGEVATRQDVILAELGVRTAEERLAHARGRSEACQARSTPSP